MSRPCRLIELSGPPHMRGMTYGREAAPEIKAGISHFAAQVKALDLSEADLKRVVDSYLPKIEAFEPRYVEEMRGIAKGAGGEFHHVVMINARTEVLKLAGNTKLSEGLLGAAPDADPNGCTPIVTMTRATAAG